MGPGWQELRRRGLPQASWELPRYSRGRVQQEPAAEALELLPPDIWPLIEAFYETREVHPAGILSVSRRHRTRGRNLC